MGAIAVGFVGGASAPAEKHGFFLFNDPFAREGDLKGS